MQKNQPAYLVFQAYGNESILQECAFALLTLSRFYSSEELKQIQVWIYTDQPEFFKRFRDCPLALNYRILNNELIKQWRGSIDFVHRVKIELLRDFTKQQQGNILYADTDVCFLQRLDMLFESIENGKQYMHVNEGVIREESNPIFKKLNRHLQANAVNVNGKEVNIPTDVAMWNAGVLGFKTGDAPLDEILDFTDSVYAKFPKHIVEQFAFSLYLQQRGTVHAAAPYILHYWNLKELRIVLASFFERFKNASWSELVKLSSLIQVHIYIQQKANFYESRSIMMKLQKKRWQPEIPNWDLLLQQL